jgi:hypothetical protein
MNEVVLAKRQTLSANELHDIMSEIAEVGRRVVNSHLALAMVIAKHERESYWDQLREELQKWIDNAIISMYVRIGKNIWITSEKNMEKLPPSYNTLYHLSFLPADELQKLDDKKKITPSVTLAEAKEFVKNAGARKSIPKQVKASKQLSIPVAVKFPDGTGKKRIAKDLLNKFRIAVEKNGGEVTWVEF